VRIFRALLRCYPPRFRRAHGDEFLQFVRLELTRGISPAALARDATAGVIREWLDLVRLPPGEPMRNLIRDFRYAARLLARTPGFTIAAVATLALGIGANTAMFTLADATLLRPVHVRAPHELVAWSWTSSYPHYQAYAERTDIFQGIAGISGAQRVNVVTEGRAEIASAIFVTGNTFDVLGAGVIYGRRLQRADDVFNGPLVALLGHDYWMTRFGGDPSVVGKTVRVNTRPTTIVGVAEPHFRGTNVAENPSLYFPTGVSNQLSTGFFARVNAMTTPGFVWLRLVGRLQPGVTATQAAAIMDVVYDRLQPPAAGTTREERLRLVPLPTRALGRSAADLRTFVLLLCAVVAFTLLVGCSNLANLLLVRTAARKRDTGVRLALGATRGRVMQYAFAESVLLAAIGGVAALGVSYGMLALLRTYELPGGLPIGRMALDLDGRALAATAALSLVTGLLFGAAPAWRASRTEVFGSLREQTRSVTSRSFARHALLTIQIGLSVVLLCGSGLFARALVAALETSPGFDPRGVVTASVNLGLAGYNADTAGTFYRAALERVKGIPDVESAAWTNMLPSRGLFRGVAEVEGYVAAPGEQVTVYGAHVGPDYFRGIGTAIRQGRAFAESDHATAPRVGIVSEVTAAKYWPGRSPVGQRFRMFDEWITVVGVAEPTVVIELGETPLPQVYLPFDQWITGRMGIALDTAHLVIRTSAPLDRVMPLVRDRLRSIDAQVPLYDLGSFETRVASLVMPQRMGAALFTMFGALTLALAILGIYGVASYLAAMRTREIGLRIALGATMAEVRRMIVTEGARPVLIGIVCGLAAALAASRTVESFLHGISRFDPLTFVTVPIALAAIALAATDIPARRASRIAPVDALRE
jgi:predicted permease